MTARTKLTLPVPPSANEYWVPARGRGLVPSEAALAYKAEIARICWGLRPLVGDVVWSGTWFRAQKSGDLGNRLKVLEDALIGFGYLDDKQIAGYQDFRRSDADPKAPRIELELTAERFATPEEAAEHKRKREERAAKTRATRNRNRATKRANGFRVKARAAVYR